MDATHKTKKEIDEYVFMEYVLIFMMFVLLFVTFMAIRETVQQKNSCRSQGGHYINSVCYNNDGTILESY